MPDRFSELHRRPAFELVEPRLFLSAAGLTAAGDFSSDAPALYLPGAISGSVYAVDEISGELPGNGEAVSGVRLQLLSEAGEVLAEAITDDAGGYEFPALEPGEYAIRQIQPPGFQDGGSRIGSGGSTAVIANVVGEIVVTPGAMLAGYDFFEVHATATTEAEAPLPQFHRFNLMPPLTVAWSRPSVDIAEQVTWPAAAAPLPTALPELRPPEPIFGGSSGVIEEERVSEAFSDAEFIDNVATTVPSDSAEQTGERVAMKRREWHARDKAFELDAESADDGADDDAPADAAPNRIPATPRVEAHQRDGAQRSAA